MKTIEQTYLDNLNIKSDIQEHLPILRMYGSKCDRIVELGVRYGLSTVALLSSRPLVMTSYDVIMTGMATEIYKQAQFEGLDFRLIQEDSTKADIPKCDLLFIDTLHTDVQLLAELYLHSQKVNKYIILHDTAVYALIGGGEQGIIPESRGLMFAIVEFLHFYENSWKVGMHYTNCNGLTILERR